MLFVPHQIVNEMAPEKTDLVIRTMDNAPNFRDFDDVSNYLYDSKNNKNLFNGFFSCVELK